MRWLIIEDSLENKNGHWFEYLSDFYRGLPELGDTVTWLVSKNASPIVVEHFQALPILPESAFKKLSIVEPFWRRMVRIPVHGWKTFWIIRKFLKCHQNNDIIFIPTVVVHHLLGWYFLIKFVLGKQRLQILLFFPSLPILKQDFESKIDGSPTARLMRILFDGLKPEIKSGKVILGVETHAMKKAAEEVFEIPFTYFPHPVTPVNVIQQTDDTITMACYGAARYEKGSDLLVTAIEQYLQRYPESNVKFVLQWINDFSLPDGSLATIPEMLEKNPKVEIINRLFVGNEYEERLAVTSVVLLPYRSSSYNLRVSRVLIEALVNGIPAVVTAGTTLAQQKDEYGVDFVCKDGDIESLVMAIHKAALSIQNLNLQSDKGDDRHKLTARNHFSVSNFQNYFITN